MANKHNRPYLAERQSEYWTSRQIEEYFLDQGFEVIALPLQQFTENKIPADYIFFDKNRSKLFGLQYKALYMNNEDYWPIDQTQHTTLSKYSWIYYCFSEMKHGREARAALHFARIRETNFKYEGKKFPTGAGRVDFYHRWGAFYQKLESCICGIKVDSAELLKELIMGEDNEARLTELADLAVDTFLADFDSQRLIHLSPYLRNLSR